MLETFTDMDPVQKSQIRVEDQMNTILDEISWGESLTKPLEDSAAEEMRRANLNLLRSKFAPIVLLGLQSGKWAEAGSDAVLSSQEVLHETALLLGDTSPEMNTPEMKQFISDISGKEQKEERNWSNETANLVRDRENRLPVNILSNLAQTKLTPASITALSHFSF